MLGEGMKRIQRRRVKGWRMPEGAIYVGRPTYWGNPQRVTKTFGPNYSVMTYFGLMQDRLELEPEIWKPRLFFRRGCSTINGSVVVDAGVTVLADCGGDWTFDGSVTNDGVMMADNGRVLESSGTLVNNSKILLLHGGTNNFHGTFINNDGFLNADTVLSSNVTRAGNDVLIQIPSVTGFTYRQQLTPSLQPPAWADSDTAKAGTDSVLPFTDPGTASNWPSRFHRMQAQ